MKVTIRKMWSVMLSCTIFQGTWKCGRVGQTFGSMRAWQPSAGVARRPFFLLRHLSKFLSFKNENPSCHFWDMALGIFAVAFEKRSLPPYTRDSEYAGVVWSGVVLFRRKPENPWSSKQVSRVPLYASAPIAYDGPVYARVDAARWSCDCS